MEELPPGTRSEDQVRFLPYTIVLALLLSSCGGQDYLEEPGVYDVNALNSERRTKDESFRMDEESPIPASIRQAFKGLHYFPPNPDMAVNARFMAETTSDTVELSSTRGEIRRYMRAGIFSFTIGGRACSLVAFRPTTGEHRILFVPFRDSTSGITSYPAARYMEVFDTGDSLYVLDFNGAYNPWCAYNDRFSCTLPPQSNVLSVAITAGEKIYEHH